MNDEIRRLDAIIYDDSRDTPERFAACLERYYAQCRYFGIDPNPHCRRNAGAEVIIERRALLTGVAAAAITQLAPSGAECAGAGGHAYTVAFEGGTGAVRKVYYGLSFPEVLDQAEQEGMTLTDIWKGTGELPPVFEARYVDFIKPRLLPVLRDGFGREC